MFRLDLLKKIDRHLYGVSCWIGRILSSFGRPQDLGVLMVRPGGMGDLICLQIAVESLGFDPKAFYWLIEKRSEPWAIHQGLSYQCYDASLLLIFRRWLGAFNLVINTEQSFGLSQALARACLSRGGVLAGFSTNRAASLSSLNCFYDPYVEHETLAFKRLTQEALSFADESCQLFSSQKMKKNTADGSPKTDSSGSEGPLVVGIAGLQSESRNFSVDQWETLIRKWAGGRRFSIVASAVDRGFALELHERFQGQSEIAHGSFTECCELIARAAELFTVDGGLVHVASYYGVPCTVVFTSGRMTKWLPLASDSSVFKRVDLNCQPCSLFGQVPPCAFDYACKAIEKMNHLKSI